MATQQRRRKKRKTRRSVGEGGRWGAPRKTEVPNRLTLRMDTAIYKALNEACDRLHVSQRDLIEAALQHEFDREPDAPQGPKRAGKVSRTGIWIDPILVSQLDIRMEMEGTTQRAIVERAVLRELAMRAII